MSKRNAVDNFELLKPLFECVNDDQFYYLEIIRRKKENPEDSRHMTVIKDIWLDKYHTLNTEEHLIKKYCEMFNARAYLRLNIRSYEQVGREMDSKMSELRKQSQYKKMKSAFASTAGKVHNQKPAIWMIDLDNDLPYFHHEVIDLVKHLRSEVPARNKHGEKLKEPMLVPTLNGYHLLTHPFNASKFNPVYPECKISKASKNNPTLLYAPAQP